ncbi:MAG: cytochrome c3 family protein [Desulfuromonadales bacterium]
MTGYIMLFFTVLLASCSILYASDCYMIEYPEKIDLICNGLQKDKTQKDIPVYRPSQPAVAQIEAPKPSVNACKMLQANHYDIAKNSIVDVEISCSVTGQKSEQVEFLLYGLNGNNERLLTTVIIGQLDNFGFGDLKKTFGAEFSKFINVHRWEPDTIGGTILMSKKYLYNETETIARAVQIKNVFEDWEKQATTANLSTPSGDNVLRASMGSVTFKHSTHSSESCSSCHTGSTQARIPELSKDWAHKTCKGCHTESKRGPTGCKDCHKK